MTATEIYERDVRSLPPSERLRLATLILNEIPPQSMADYKTEWSDQDLADFARQNWARAEAAEEHGEIR